jgi:4-hydroxy-tetrahydrodipicolinate synthase
MVQLAFDKKVDEAYEIHNKLVEITRLIFAEGNPCGIKVVLAEKGLIKNYLRLPLVPASEGLYAKIKAEMAKI